MFVRHVEKNLRATSVKEVNITTAEERAQQKQKIRGLRLYASVAVKKY